MAKPIADDPESFKDTAALQDYAEAQRGKVRDYLRSIPVRKWSRWTSRWLDAAVPRQAQLTDLPAGLADLLYGSNGDQYLLVRDQMIIVDSQSRRIVALIPGVG
jgi:hypothetical protein